MKKRILCLLLLMLMVTSMFYIPVSAHQEINFSTDFSGYELKPNQWDGVTVTTGGAMPDAVGGVFAPFKGQTFFQGASAGVASDDKYGTSIKVHQEYNADITGYYGGVTYTFNTFPQNSYYLGFSMNVEKTEDEKYVQRSLRLFYDNGGVLVPALFEGDAIKTFGVDTGIKWEADKWYDFKVWINRNSGYYTTEVSSGGILLATVSNQSASMISSAGLKRVEFYHNSLCDKATNWIYKDAEGNSVTKQPQITYYDNFEFKTIYKYEIDEKASASHTVLDFEEIDTTSAETIKKYKNDKGSFTYGYQGVNEGMDLESVTTDRGKGVRIVPWVIPKDSDKYTVTGGVVYDKATGAKLYDRGRMLYNCIYYTRNKANYITDAMYFKSGFKFEDSNFGEFHMGISGNYYSNVIYVKPNGEFTVMGKASGITFEIDKWYDLEGTLDADTGYYIISLKKESGEAFETSGYAKSIDKVSNGEYAGNYRLTLNYYNRSTNNDWSIPTSMIVDHMQFGPVSKLKAPVAASYGFSNSDDATAFTTSGGTAAIDSEVLKITGSADSETAVSMAMPFTTTTFKYAADVALGDLSADRTLIVNNRVGTGTTTPVEVARFGADGKLYIGGTEVADVNIEAGTYTADVVFNQVGYNAAVTISKDGEAIAEGTAVLGTAAVKIVTVDWKVGAGTETVTSLDNISYSTVYDFEIDETFSTTGEDKIVTAGDDVIAKFTNPIDRTTFTNDSISINTNAAIKEIVFVDNYTVKVDFEKEQGTHYYIRFVDVADIYGNNLTDYIEFDTIKQDMVMTATSFKRDGEVLSLSSAGDVTATFTAKANNGKTFDMLYVLCMYEGGKIVQTVHDVFTVGETREEHPLNVTIPNDGKYYILKTFLWDAKTLEPYRDPEVLKPIADQPIALVKLDDLTNRDGVLKAFERSLSFAEENNIKMNFGLIGTYLEYDATDESRARILNFYNHPLIELWSHAYDPSIILGNVTDEEQEEDFRLANDTAAKYGITFKSFSAPSGSMNAYTGEMLNKYNFKVMMTTNGTVRDNLENWGMLDPDNTYTVLEQERFNLEPTATGNTRDVEELKEMWLTACENGDQFEILQVHPNGWGGYEGSEQRFYDFLLWLKARGVVFMTFEEYVDYASAL